MKKRIICPFDEKNLSTDLISEVLNEIEGVSYKEDGRFWCGYLQNEDGLTGFCIATNNSHILDFSFFGNVRNGHKIINGFLDNIEAVCEGALQIEIDVDYSLWNIGRASLKYFWVIY